MTTASNTLQDRRQRAANLLDGMVAAAPNARIIALRDLAAQCLGLSAANRPAFAVTGDNLPGAADIIAEMPNPYGNDIIAVHFDLTTAAGAGGRVSNAQAQAANAAVQNYAGKDRNPLLIFILPEAVQFIYGEPEPGNPGRLRSVQRLTYRRGERNRTTLDALEQIGQAIAGGQPPQIALAHGFNVQPVTEAFFQDYKAAYDATTAELAAQMPPDDAAAYAQTLFNRLLFVHFVSRKGWLSFNGNRDYLNALWADYRGNPAQTSFYADRPDALFHDGMNTPPEQRPQNIEQVIGQAPYLNGGLFERSALDQQRVRVSDHIIEALLAPDGLFNRYNFTVTEATPLDTEVAVDPEMLGKLFEETVNERHSSSAYYTPRPVVAFMCREAIKGYLAGRNIPGLSDAKIADLVDNRNPHAITPPQALDIANAVADLKAVDPACGSGAFLLGMMQEILALNDSLFRAGHTPDTLYRQKLGIITSNLHGADKDALAVSTAMLRLWLSLAVDYDGAGAPAPLPNLDLKLAAGDALAGPDPQQRDLTLMSIISSGLQQDIAAYTTAHGPQKEALKRRVDDVKVQLRSRMRDAAPSDVVEWRIDFATVTLAGGFDIVIANPPYVRQEEIAPPQYKQSLLKAYPDAAVGRSDLYCYFYARGLQLLKPGGMHIFVCSNSWLDVGYGAKLQEYLLDNATLDAIYESAVERQFATADINTIISVIRKADGAGEGSDATRFVQLRAPLETALADAGRRREIVKTRAELRAAATSGRRFVGDKWGGKYLRAPDIYHHILDKYGDKLARLGDIANVRFGIKTGANDFFYLTPERIKEFGIEDEFLAPVMTSPTESRSIIVDPATLPYQVFMCHKDRADLKGAGALAYIEWAERKHQWHTRPSTKNRRNWYDLGERQPPPVAVHRITDERTKAFRSDGQTHYGNTLYEVHCADNIADSLADELNNDFSQVQYNVEGRANFGGGALELTREELARVQVPNFSAGGGQIRFTASEQQALEAALRELVNHRRLRAKSA